MENLDSKPSWLRATARGAVGVDREAGVIRGVILAEEGPFKDERGEFDRASIRAAVKLAQAKTGGLKARWTHPNLSSDGLGKFVGRHKNVRNDTVLREVGKAPDGKPLMKEKAVARGDLHLDKTALDEPVGGGKPLGVYLMDLAESDPDAMGLSLVLKADQQLRLDERKRPLTDEKGNQLPPLWTPLELHACDCVDDGDATHSFLSADLLGSLPDALVRQGCELLDAQFAGKDREFVSAHLSAFTERYLNHKFGEPEETEAAPVEQSQPMDEATALLLQVALEEG